MVKWNEFYGNRYLNSEDVGKKAIQTTITNIEVESALQGDTKEMKCCATFKAFPDKVLVLNGINCKTLDAAFGEETDDWIGAQVELTTVPVEVKGRMVSGVRIKVLGKQEPQPKKGKNK